MEFEELFPAGSVAVAVIVFEFEARVMLFAVKVPFDTVAAIPFTVTIAWLSFIVPDTVIGCADDVDPFCGDVIAITGA